MSALIDGKVVVSYPLPAMPNTHSALPPTVKQVIYMAFKTRLMNKTLITGMAIGEVAGEDFKVTETGQGVINSMAKAPEFKGRLVVVECRKSNTANERIIAALKTARDGDGILIICKDNAIYDDIEIYKLLGVERTEPAA